MNSSRNGYAALIVLVAVAIIAIMIAIQMRAIFGTNLPSQPIGTEQRPWLLDKQILGAEEGVKMPKSPKPQLEEDFSISGIVTRNNAERGTVTIFFESNGRIRATWSCDYSHEQTAYRIGAEIAGNIDAGVHFTDENGKDKSRLFFVGKGTYFKETTTADTGTAVEKGTAYVQGWLKPDGSAEGFVSINQGKDWVAAYEWAAPPAK